MPSENPAVSKQMYNHPLALRADSWGAEQERGSGSLAALREDTELSWAARQLQMELGGGAESLEKIIGILKKYERMSDL